MILNVRGALGTQVLEFAVGLAKAQKENTVPSLIKINTGGKVISTVKVDWLSSIIDLPCPVELVEGRSKQRAWTKKNFSLLNESVIKNINLRQEIKLNNLTLVHVRGKDRQTASLDDYVKIVKHAGNDVKLIGDDQQLINQIIETANMGENISGSPQQDWYTCIGANTIYSSFSSFTISAALFDPNKKMYILNKENSHGPASVDLSEYDCIKILINSYLKNSEMI